MLIKTNRKKVLRRRKKVIICVETNIMHDRLSARHAPSPNFPGSVVPRSDARLLSAKVNQWLSLAFRYRERPNPGNDRTPGTTELRERPNPGNDRTPGTTEPGNDRAREQPSSGTPNPGFPICTRVRCMPTFSDRRFNDRSSYNPFRLVDWDRDSCMSSLRMFRTEITINFVVSHVNKFDRIS
jgi:hypothetical protein